jgi:hypothetical protein
LGSGLFPICQKGAKELFGVGFGLIHSVLETPKAPTHPHAFRVGVPGISTAQNQNPQTSPLICKGEIVQRYKVLTSKKRDSDEVHVPAGQKSDVKGWYDEELHSGNDELIKVSHQHLNKVWANSFPHLKCRAFLRWFCLCTCTLVNQQLSHHMVVPCQICCM